LQPMEGPAVITAAEVLEAMEGVRMEESPEAMEDVMEENPEVVEQEGLELKATMAVEDLELKVTMAAEDLETMGVVKEHKSPAREIIKFEKWTD